MSPQQILALGILAAKHPEEVETRKNASQLGPPTWVNVNAVHNLAKLRLARMHLRYGGRVTYSATAQGVAASRPLVVACPRCYRQPGKPCVKLAGVSGAVNAAVPTKYPHDERIMAAADHAV